MSAAPAGSPAVLPAALEARPRGRFAGRLAWNAASEAAARGASLWLSFAGARLLPVEGFGRFAFALALAQYGWLAGDAVINAGYATREVARARGAHDPGAPALAGFFARARLGAALVLSALAALALAAWPAPLETRRPIAGAMLYFVAYAAFPDWALRGAEDFRGLALANAAAALALVAGTALLLPAHADPALAAALWAGSFGVAALVAWPRLAAARAVTWPDGTQRWRAHVRHSAVFSLGAVLGIGVAQAPLLLTGALASPYATGLFGAAWRLVVAVVGVFSVLWWPVFPVLARSRPGTPAFRDTLVPVASLALLLALPAALAFTLWSRELLTLAFGARYAGAATALRIAGAGLPAFALSALLEWTCLASGGERVRAAVQGGTLAALAIAGLVLIPRFGANGAAASALGGFALALLAYLVTLRRVLPWRALALGVRAPLALNAALAAAWLAARAAGAPALPAMLAGAALYGLGALAIARRTQVPR